MIEVVRERERGALDRHPLLRRLQHTVHNVKQSIESGEKYCRFVTYEEDAATGRPRFGSAAARLID